MKRLRNQRKGIGLLLLLLCNILILANAALAEDVTFKLDIPDAGSIQVGDTFEIRVLLDTTKTIKRAEFQLTPSTGASIDSAATAGLLSSPTYLYGASGAATADGGRRYGEVTTGTAVLIGTNLHFATLTATASAAGSTTFDFSNLAAAQGAFQRTVTSIPSTITITAAEEASVPSGAPVPSCTDECPAAGAITCTSSILYRECRNFDADSCLEGGSITRCAGATPRCTGADWAGVCENCGNNIIEGTELCDGTDLGVETCVTQAGAGYTGTLTCGRGCDGFDESACVRLTPTATLPARTRLQTLQDDMGTAIDQEAPEPAAGGQRNWNPRLISRLAQLLRDFFS